MAKIQYSPFRAMPSYTENRKARHDYETLQTYEGGLALSGSEAKSIREGGAKLTGAFLKIMNGELWLIGAHISPYSKDGRQPPFDPTQRRKVLVHKNERRQLAEKINEKGLTLVPFSLYSKGRRLKLSFAVCRGKKAHDKRDALRERDISRETRRVLRGRDEEY
jgi:SsrA-binding protein